MKTIGSKLVTKDALKEAPEAAPEAAPKEAPKVAKKKAAPKEAKKKVTPKVANKKTDGPAGRKSAYTGLFVRRKSDKNPFRDGSELFKAFASIPSSGSILFDKWRLLAGEDKIGPRRLHLANMIKKKQATVSKTA